MLVVVSTIQLESRIFLFIHKIDEELGTFCTVRSFDVDFEPFFSNVFQLQKRGYELRFSF